MRRKLPSFALALVLAAPVAANPLKLPTADYTADVSYGRGSGSAEVRVFYTPHRIRMEPLQRTSAPVTLIDFDRREVISYVSGRHTVEPVPTDIDERVFLLFGFAVDEAERVGAETLLGYAVTKFKVRGHRGNVPFVGDVWTTAENIPIRMEGTEGQDPRHSPNFGFKVSRVEIAPIDAALFAVPTGSVKVDTKDLRP